MFVSYAQNFEDVMLWRALRHVGTGFYIDAGAYDPVSDSVTKAFYERRWRGINIEPAPAPYARLLAERPNDININAALGEQEGSAPFYLVAEGNGLSTLSPDFARTHQGAGWAQREIAVEVKTLASICELYAPSVIHFLKIDVEGAEASVLRGADFARFRPWIILIEATKPNSQIPTHQEWENLLIDAAYEFIYFDGLNRFYLAAEQREALAPAFNAPPNVFDGFVRAREVQLQNELALAKAQSASLGGGAAPPAAPRPHHPTTVSARSVAVALRDLMASLLAPRTAAAQPDAPLYRLGTPVEFRRHGNAKPYLRGGWSGEEPQHIWTEGADAYLAFACDDAKEAIAAAGQVFISLVLRPLVVPGKLDSQRIIIHVNGHLVASETLAKMTTLQVAVPAGVFLACHPVQLRLSVPDHARPCDLYNSKDARQLGVAVIRAQIDLG
jgi:FkbM family methyltransferase